MCCCVCDLNLKILRFDVFSMSSYLELLALAVKSKKKRECKEQLYANYSFKWNFLVSQSLEVQPGSLSISFHL